MNTFNTCHPVKKPNGILGCPVFYLKGIPPFLVHRLLVSCADCPEKGGKNICLRKWKTEGRSFSVVFHLFIMKVFRSIRQIYDRTRYFGHSSTSGSSDVSLYRLFLFFY